MLETVDVLIHAVHPIPVGQAAHRVLQRHRPHIVRGDQLVDQGKHVLVQREWMGRGRPFRPMTDRTSEHPREPDSISARGMSVAWESR